MARVSWSETMQVCVFKCTHVLLSKASKHGHSKVLVQARGIFTGNIYEHMCRASHMIEFPFVRVRHVEYEVLNADASTGWWGDLRTARWDVEEKPEVAGLQDTTTGRSMYTSGSLRGSCRSYVKTSTDTASTAALGSIQSAEFGKLLVVQLGRESTEHEQRAALEEHDCNQDGAISFNEYVDWLYKINGLEKNNCRLRKTGRKTENWGKLCSRC